MTTLPDTGSRTEFETGAVRDGKTGKGLMSEIPPCALRRLGVHFQSGAKHYGLGNWRKGIPMTSYYDSIMRHLLQIGEGSIEDPDPHAALCWNIICMMWTQEQITAGRLPKELDDLPYRKTQTP